MDAAFWHERWETGRTGFHREHVNARLAAHWQRVAAGRGHGRVFVPLCGKSEDMRWIAAHGWKVLGVELSPIAVRDFFAAGGLEPRRSADGAFERWEAGAFTLLCGDFFALDRARLDGIDAVYDRASLIALPAPLRGRYAAHLLATVAAAAPMLTVTLEYDAREMDGPPFNVNGAEVRRLFAAARDVEEIGCDEILDEELRLRERGLSRLTERAYLIA